MQEMERKTTDVVAKLSDIATVKTLVKLGMER